MELEAVIVMVVGLVSLTALRLILAVVGRDFAADHPGYDVPQATPGRETSAQAQVRRGTGRNRHLLYFAPVAPVSTPVREPVSPVVGPVIPGEQRRAS